MTPELTLKKKVQLLWADNKNLRKEIEELKKVLNQQNSLLERQTRFIELSPELISTDDPHKLLNLLAELKNITLKQS